MNSVNVGFIFKYLYVWTHKRVVLCCEALSVKSGNFSHWRAAFWAASPALQYPSQVSPTSWLRGALKSRLLSVVNVSLPAIHKYKYQLRSAPGSSHWCWVSQKASMPQWQAGDLDHKGYKRKWREQRHDCRLPQLLFPSHFLCTY